MEVSIKFYKKCSVYFVILIGNMDGPAIIQLENILISHDCWMLLQDPSLYSPAHEPGSPGGPEICKR